MSDENKTYYLNMAQGVLSEALTNLRLAQRYILIGEGNHPYLEKRMQSLINNVNKVQNDVADYIKWDTKEAES